MQNKSKILTALVLSGALAACSTTSQTPEMDASTNAATTAAPAVQAESMSPATDGTITLEQVMAHPDWLGRQPQKPFWSLDSEQVRYWRKRDGQPIEDLWQSDAANAGNGDKLSLSEYHLADNADRVFNSERSQVLWVFENNLFIKNLDSGEVRQLTRTDKPIQSPQFLLDGRIAYQSGNGFYAIHPQSGFTELLVSWQFSEPPKANKELNDYLAREQVKLIDYVAKERADRHAKFEHKQALQQQNPATGPQPFYLKEGFKTVDASLSPDGKRVILAIQEDKPSRSDGDIMPNYINEDGRIYAESARRMVADAESVNQELLLLELEAHQQHALSYQTLPGYNEDVLAEVKKENAEAKGETYEPNRLPRDIGLMTDWYWHQSAIEWHNSGEQVAVMLQAWDNKDRWIATVDLKDRVLVSQHRLHDDAWINYKFNSFGWLNNSQRLYFLSEQSGYAHLYLQTPGTKEQALTYGDYVVDDLTLTHDDQYIYFRANKKHPGIYEIYRVNLENGAIEPITDMGGMNEYVLSPDEQRLIITHSKITMPPELYVQRADVAQRPMKLTSTVSEAFQSLPWTAPKIMPVPSSHTDKPIYSKVYLPEDYQAGEKRKAVIFNHGAGYLQNSHMGWSGYFREFMFHSMLVQQGYVVMDMDYRASQGYGRDWRTAIYRQMGTPETQDLSDGVNWLVNNANVGRDNVCTYGGSYGGFMTFMALFTEPDLFQCGAALRPVTDWAYYNTPYTSNILNTPQVDPIAYKRSSPIYHAEGLEKPLLINAPMIDDNVFFVDVVRLVQRLIELEKQDFETAIYPVEPHGFRQPSSWLDEYRRIYKLFEENLE
ncbi:prolyl oligopeptidase family serine peptidase [Saliniradius amylolyticus]|nr:prolyl oligopeptidase family serine peptidase [Saliniradius amylolyticus]